MWYLLTLGSAFFVGTSDGLSKHMLRFHQPRMMSLVRVFWGSMFLLPLVSLADSPHSPKVFWVCVISAIPFEVTASLMYQTALQSSPLSLCVPFLAFTPVFLLGMAWIFLKEIPTPLGILGVVLVTTGAFFIQSDGKSAPAQVFKKFFEQKGPVLMMGVAFIYAITSVLAKKALTASSPFYFSGIYYLLIVLGLLPVQWKRPNWKEELISKPKWFAAIGACEALSFILQFHAFLLAKTAYVIAVKRLSLLFAVLYGAIFFNEEKILRRTAGAVLMLLGAGLIAVA